MTPYDHLPKGWTRVQAALTDRIPWAEVGSVLHDWQASRFTATDALEFIVEHHVLRVQGTESWLREHGVNRPADLGAVR